MTVKEYFTRYASIDSQSDAASSAVPSTKGQLMLAMVLTGDLCDLGVFAQMDDYGYVYATIPATPGYESLPSVGLIAHMDTSEAAPGRNVKPLMIQYSGGDLVRGDGENAVMHPDDFPELRAYVGKELITTDGSTLLGADDKAGIAEIVALCEALMRPDAAPHGTVQIAFTPDEEIGRGTSHFDLERFGADFAYTVDGGALGQVQYENFNAACAQLMIEGVSTHPGQAYGKMINACLLAQEFISLLPVQQRPEQTQGYEGFYHLEKMQGVCRSAKLTFLIRDHDDAAFAQKKLFFQHAADQLAEKYPAAKVQVQIRDNYRNMKRVLAAHPHVIQRALDAMQACGIEPIIEPIRGGTDGAMLSWKGLPCPNLSTGGYRFHSCYEFIPTCALEAMVRVLMQIVAAR